VPAVSLRSEGRAGVLLSDQDLVVIEAVLSMRAQELRERSEENRKAARHDRQRHEVRLGLLKWADRLDDIADRCRA
jgi:hypothetical protein